MRTLKPPRYIETSALYYEGRWESRFHAHPCHELGVCVAGCQGVETDGASFTVQEGDVVFYPAGTEHREWNATKRALSVHYLHFDCSDFPVRQPVRMHDAQGHLRTLLDWLFAEKLSHTPVTAELAQALTTSMAVQLAKLYHYPDVGLVLAIRRYVRAHLRETLDLDELAHQAGLSKYLFLRTYKQLAGRTPMEDVRIIRLETARQLIMTTAIPLKVVATEVGFHDYRRMLQLFRRTFGTSPGKCRLNMRRRTRSERSR